MDESIRNLYERLGVDAYYKKYGEFYENPHFEQIESLIVQNESKLDYSNILDFACGGGEICSIIKTLGYNKFTASDPYTAKLFEKQLQQTCLSWSFLDVVKGKLSGNYSCIICSFALHLCPENLLYDLAIQLFKVSPILVIITPHKRPQLEKFEGISLNFEDYCLTPKGKKVRLKAYKYDF